MRDRQIDTMDTISSTHTFIVYIILLGIAANFALASYCHHWQQLLPTTHAPVSTVGHIHQTHDVGMRPHSDALHVHDTIPVGSEFLQTIVSLLLLMMAGWMRILTDIPLLLWVTSASVLVIAGICLVPPERPPRTSRHVLSVA